MKNTGYIYIFGAGCCWGVMGLFIKTLNSIGSYPALTSLVRIVVALCVLLAAIPIMRGGTGFRIGPKGLLFTFFASLLGVVAFNLAYNISAMSVGVSVAGVLIYTSPIFTFILSRAIFKERITAGKYLAIAVNICGCVLTVTNGRFDIDIKSTALLGIVMGVMAGLTYACLTIFSKLAENEGTDPLAVTLYSFVIAALMFFVMAKPWAVDIAIITPKFVLFGILLGFISTAFAYILYMTGLQRVSSVSMVPVVASVETVVAALVGYFCFDEGLGVVKMIGIALVITSIVIANTWKQTS